MQLVELQAAENALRSSMKAKQIIIASALYKQKKRVVSHKTTMASWYMPMIKRKPSVMTDYDTKPKLTKFQHTESALTQLKIHQVDTLAEKLTFSSVKLAKEA